MSVSAVAAHGRQDGIGNFFIFPAGLTQLPNFFRIQFHQLSKAFLIPGKEYKKSQNKYQDRGDHGHIKIIFGIRENRPQQTVRVARIQQ